MKNRIASLVLGTVSLLAASSAFSADHYPSKPITVIVPYAAGGVVDVQTRALTQRLATELGQPVVVDAKPGASGSIAADFVARAPADGYTILVSATFLTINPMLVTGLRWAPKNFTPVARFSLAPSYLVVPMSSPAKSVKEFVDLAKKAKPSLQYGSGGVGTPQDLAVEMLKLEAGIQLESVLYKGGPPVIPDLISGLISMAVLPSSVAYPQIASGKVRALANINSRRSAQLPNVPTTTEAGYPGTTAISWYGFHVPAGTPPEVIKKLEAAVLAATGTQEVKERLINTGGEEAFLNTAEFTSFLKTDALRWEKVAKAIKK